MCAQSKYLDLIKKNIVLFDGAMGTRLYEKGVFINRCFEEVNLTDPALVEAVHTEMVEAGAQVITTNSFGANFLKLKGYNLSDSVEAINAAAVRIAKKAIGDADILIAGSVGPLGVRIEPFGKLSAHEAERYYAQQIGALVSAGVDLILLETFSNIDELLLAARTVKSIDAAVPVQAQFSLRPYDEKGWLSTALEYATKLDADANVDVVGANCIIGPADMLDLLEFVRPKIKKPFSVMPNAGFPKEVDGRQIYLASPDYFAEYALKFMHGGASVIGGCCGTSAEHIEKMGKAVLSLNKSHTAIKIHDHEEGVVEKQEVELEKRSAFGAALKAGDWITSIELVPPVGVDFSGIIEKSKQLIGKGITCINIPDGPRASSRISALMTSIEIQRATGIETMPHICSRDRNLIGIQSDMLAAQASGIRNILFITGDPPKVGNYPDVTGVFDVDSIGMLSLARNLNHGLDFGGKSIPGQTTFVKGSGADPASLFREKEIERSFKKAEAGAEFFFTQPVFDVESLVKFLEEIKGTNVPVIAGVWPLASYRNALFMNNEVPGVSVPDHIMKRMEKAGSKEEARLEGIAIAREIVEQIRPYVRGIQVSPPFGNIDTALRVLAK
ncbi:MAG: bifunctional homocysteine S-methyltransferase/methylenetetrahydrofolate reductase [Spirochaetales bacterium]|nr:bifunctional homocysteine S-methyltransferase/methylenetetrahydrofolate reductase [Spirochaetales bacterium]